MRSRKLKNADWLDCSRVSGGGYIIIDMIVELVIVRWGRYIGNSGFWEVWMRVALGWGWLVGAERGCGGGVVWGWFGFCGRIVSGCTLNWTAAQKRFKNVNTPPYSHMLINTIYHTFRVLFSSHFGTRIYEPIMNKKADTNRRSYGSQPDQEDCMMICVLLFVALVYLPLFSCVGYSCIMRKYGKCYAVFGY